MKNAEKLDEQLHQLLEGELDEDGMSKLNLELLNSPTARARYRHTMALHSALIQKGHSQSALEAALRTAETASSDSPSRKRSVVMLIAGALGAIMISGLSLLLLPSRTWATVLESSQVQWEQGATVADKAHIPRDQLLAFKSGSMRIGFRSGASVTLEGPCRFELKEPEALTVVHGRVSVHTPDGAQGFRIDTPGGKFIDLGTEFGLAVGSDGQAPVILTEVFKGEVKIVASSITPARLVQGESRALVKDTHQATLLSALDESPVYLNNNSQSLPVENQVSDAANLALGKPVSSPAYYASKHGSVFPPEKLTDGRLNDSGVPGDWSFWLAPNEQHGEFTVDLLQPETVVRISLQNTNNRKIGDRGVAAFEAYGSLDNKTFFKLVEGDLPRIDAKTDTIFPFRDFSFSRSKIRYLKVVVTHHYRHPERPATHSHHSGGLNEIRVFAE